MLYPYIIENIPETNKADFSIDAYEYVQFDWLVLLCCSLWYCEPIEREIRLNKIFELFDKISYIEEKVLIFIYINFLKYGNKTQCIKILEKMSKFIGHSNYLFLSSLCMKLEEDDEPNLREVQAFPPSASAQDLMMGAPSSVTREQLRDVHISVVEK